MEKGKVFCQISGKECDIGDIAPGTSIRVPLLRLIKEDFPDFDVEGYISIDELSRYRQRHIQNLLEKEKGELGELEREVLHTMKDAELISRDVDEEAEVKRTVGQRISDRVAQFGGSWTFIISFFSFMILWIVLNSYILVSRSFDPFPYILLNLLLSCLAAIQAPIIMMSQNRQEAKDRLRSQHDYQINLKSELEIRQLNEKLDHMMIHQMQRLLEVQEVQMDYLEDITLLIQRRSVQ